MSVAASLRWIITAGLIACSSESPIDGQSSRSRAGGAGHAGGHLAGIAAGGGAAGGVADSKVTSGSGQGANQADAGEAGSAPEAGRGAGDMAGSGGASEPSGTPIFVAVGYAGRRIRSTDRGVTWIDEQTLGGGGDDEFLLRAVGFGGGVFVAVGWQIHSSPDGKTWTPHDNPQHQWLGGIQFGAGGFLATGGYGYCASAPDGATWQPCKPIPGNEASRSLAVGLGKFVTATDPGNWFQSSDGSAWSLLSRGHATNQVAFCGDSFKEYAECTGAFNARARASAGGITIRLNDGKLQRSTDGIDFTAVAGSPGGLEDVAVGYMQ